MEVISDSPRGGSGPSRPGNSEAPAIIHLPPETLDGIFKYVGYDDLVSLALSCSAFHELAAARLYRDISHVFNPADSMAMRHSLDHFCAILETLASSEHDYAGFVRKIPLERASMAEVCRAERGAGADHSYTNGKLINTLLNIVLRRASYLESFRWDVRIGMKSGIFGALGKIPSLQHLHVRFPAGPLRVSSASNTSVSPTVAGTAPPSITASALPVDMTGVVQPLPQMAQALGVLHAHGDVNTVWHAIAQTEWARMKPGSSKTDFSLISGLKTLAALDIDDLGCIHELSQCITSSIPSLRSLKISLSDRLASKARGKVSAVIPDPDPASEGDDWGVHNWGVNDMSYNAPPPNVYGNGAPAAGTSSANSADDPEVDRARIVQEAVLAQLFGLNDPMSQQLADRHLEQSLLSGNAKAQALANKQTTEEEDRSFIHMMRQMARILPAAVYSGSGSSKSLKTLELVDKSTTKYLEGTAGLSSQAGMQSASGTHSYSNHQAFGAEVPGNFHGHETPVLPGPSNVTVQTSSIPHLSLAETASSHTAMNQGHLEVPSASSSGAHHNVEDHLSDIVDMEHPDNPEGTGEDQEFVSSGEGETGGDPAPSTIHTSLFNGNSKGKQPGVSLDHTDAATGADSNGKEDDALKEYIRSAHGIALDSLSLHLVPVKAALLCRAVDPYALKHLSLLNVGPQGPVWAMLGELHRIRPLQLTSIHTDNVTIPFLSFVNSLDRISELFMFECGNQSRVESLTQKTTVKIDDIKLYILDKHIRHLQRLVIRNDEDASWALSSQQARDIPVNGYNLVELAIGLTTSGYHFFVQEIQNLESLVALQIFYYHPDKCMSMVRELRNCTLDHILHFGHLQIRYLAMCFNINGPVHNHAVHIMRPARFELYPGRPRPYTTPQGLGCTAYQAPSALAGIGTSVPMSGQYSDDSDEAPETEKVHLIIKGIRLCEVVGVKMWDKDTWAVRL